MRPIMTSLTVIWWLITSVQASVQDVHVGIIAPFSGYWGARGKKMLEITEWVLDWLNTEKSNTLNGQQYNIIVHHCDMETKKEKMEEKVVPFVKGELDTRNASPWKFSDWNYLKTGAAGVEPAPHRLDALFMHWGSGFIPYGLQKLKDAGETLPVYACGSNGVPAWKTNGVNRWNFANNCGELSSDDEVRPAVNLMKQNKAKTVMFLEHPGEGSWTSSLCDGGRDQAKLDGIEILADHKLEMNQCIYDGDAAVYKKCRQENIDMFEKAFGDKLIRGNRYTADGLVICTYPTTFCDWLPEWLNENNINFGVMISQPCAGMGEKWLDWYFKKPNTKYNFDYMFGFTFVHGIHGINYNQKYHPIGFFEKYEEYSSNGMAKEIQTMRGLDINNPADPYRDALFFNGWQMFIQDLYYSKGDVSKRTQYFGGHRPPLPSHWGPLSQTPAGWSKFNKALVTQVFPAWQNEGKTLLVSPLDVAQALVSYPAPFWTKRACEDKCVPCAKCEELRVTLEIATYIIIGATAALALFGALVAKLVGGVKTPGIIMNSGAMFGAFLLNLITDCVAILTLLAQMEEEILAKDNLGPYFYIAFTAMGLLPAWSRLKIHLIGYFLGWKVKSTDRVVYFFKTCDMIACMAGSVFDLALFALQCYTALLAPSYALITSMLMTALSLGYAVACPETFILLRRLIKIGDREKRDYAPEDGDEERVVLNSLRNNDVDFNLMKVTLRILSPVHFKILPSMTRVQKIKVKANDDKSQ